MEASCPLQTPAVGISSVGTDHRGRIGIRERKRYGEAAPHVGDEGGSEVNQTGVGRTFNASVCNARRRAPKLSSRSRMRTALQSSSAGVGEGSASSVLHPKSRFLVGRGGDLLGMTGSATARPYWKKRLTRGFGEGGEGCGPLFPARW